MHCDCGSTSLSIFIQQKKKCQRHQKKAKTNRKNRANGMPCIRKLKCVFACVVSLCFDCINSHFIRWPISFALSFFLRLFAFFFTEISSAQYSFCLYKQQAHRRHILCTVIIYLLIFMMFLFRFDYCFFSLAFLNAHSALVRFTLTADDQNNGKNSHTKKKSKKKKMSTDVCLFHSRPVVQLVEH